MVMFIKQIIQMQLCLYRMNHGFLAQDVVLNDKNINENELLNCKTI